MTQLNRDSEVVSSNFNRTVQQRIGSSIHLLTAIERLADLIVDSAPEEADFIANNIKAIADAAELQLSGLLE